MPVPIDDADKSPIVNPPVQHDPIVNEHEPVEPAQEPALEPEPEEDAVQEEEEPDNRPLAVRRPRRNVKPPK